MKKFLITIPPFLILLLYTFSFSIPGDDSPKNKTLAFLKTNLAALIVQTDSLAVLIEQEKNPKEIQSVFRRTRIRFKKAELFLAGIPVTYDEINGPAVQRSFEYNPAVTIEPHGLQVIEQYLFPVYDHEHQEKLLTETRLLKNLFQSLLDDFENNFRYDDYTVWEKIRLHIIYITSLGITGYDSPLAQYSIEETKASLESIRTISFFYEKEINQFTTGGVDKIGSLITGAGEYYRGVNFNSFNRLEFTSNILNPLYNYCSLVAASFQPAGYKNSSYVRYNSSSIFAENTFSYRNVEQNPDNAFDTGKAALGKKLFYDVSLSKDHNLSCASCHLPQKGFADGLVLPRSFNNEQCLKRNTPTLLNAAFQSRFFFDSRAGSLESQSIAVITNKCEGNENTYHLAERISKNAAYREAFGKLYKIQEDVVTIGQVSNAVASYIKSLEFFNSRFDLYLRGQKNILTAAEKRGYNLFAGKAKCGTCHFAPLFNGAVPPLYIETESEVLGIPVDPYSKKIIGDADEGKFMTTHNAVDKFSFKIPSLRNIGLTAPYMHNGAYKTLADVIEFYNKGGGAGIGIHLDNQTLPPGKLNLSATEKNDLLAFLGALTDTRLLPKTKTGKQH